MLINSSNNWKLFTGKQGPCWAGMITDVLWMAVSRNIMVYSFQCDSTWEKQGSDVCGWHGNGTSLHINKYVRPLWHHFFGMTNLYVQHSQHRNKSSRSSCLAACLPVDPTPDERQRSCLEKNGGEGKHQCADCGRLNRTLAKCRRTPCLTADLIVLKEHLCVPI